MNVEVLWLCHTEVQICAELPYFSKRVWLHYVVKIRRPTEIKDKLNVLINIYAPKNDKDITNFLNYPRTILQNENLEEEENIIIAGKINCPPNPALDKKRWYNVTEEISYWNHWLFTRRTWFGWHLRIKNPSLKSFTWSKNSPMILWRLDYWLILNNLQDSVSVTNIIPCIKTRHAAISLDFNISQNHVKGPGYWEMNCFLLDDDNYQRKVTAKIPVLAGQGQMWPAGSHADVFGIGLSISKSTCSTVFKT